MSYILSIDTCGRFYSIAILKNTKLMSEYVCNEIHKQCEELAIKTEKLLFQNNLQYKDLTGIAVTIGPGSFSGVRIGSSFVYSISIALNIPRISISTLEMIGYKVFYNKQDINEITVAYEMNETEALMQSFKIMNGILEPINDSKKVVIQEIENNQEVVRFSIKNFNYNDTISNAYAAGILANHKAVDSSNMQLIYGKPPSIHKK